jgi:DNA helicase HerA-like ATPase
LKLHEILFERNGVTILELDLEMPSHLKTYLKEAILSYTMLYYLHKGEAEKDEFRTAIFLEEFQSLLPDSKIEFQIGSSMIDMFFRESRKFGVGLIGLSQSALLPVSVLGNAKIVSVFNLATRRDIQEAAGSLFLKQHEIPFIDLLPTGMAIMKIRGKVRNCLVQIPESPIKGKISDKKLKAQ